MVSLNIFDYIVIALYIILVLFVMYRQKDKSDGGYLIGNRKLGRFGFTNSFVASMFGGVSIVTYTTLTYNVGFSMFWFLLGTVVGTLLVLPFMKKLKKLSVENNFYTFIDYFRFKYGNSVTWVLIVVLSFFLSSMILAQYIVGAQIFSQITGLNYSIAVVLMGLVVIGYLFLGGFNSVIKTDNIQNISLFSVVLLFFYILLNNDFSKIDLGIMVAGPIGSSLFFLYGLAGVVCFIDIWQKVYASKDNKVIKFSLIVGTILVTVLALAFIFMSLFVKSIGTDIGAENVLIHLFENYLPAGLTGFGLIIIIAAIMSSVDRGLFIASLYISKEVLKRGSEKELVRIAKILVVFLGLGYALFALLFTDLIGVIMNGFNFALVLLIPILVSFYFDSVKSISVFICMLLSSIIAFLGLFGIIPLAEFMIIGVGLVSLIGSEGIIKLKK